MGEYVIDIPKGDFGNQEGYDSGKLCIHNKMD